MLTIELLEKRLKETQMELEFALETCWSEKGKEELLKLKKNLEMQEIKIAELKKYLGE